MRESEIEEGVNRKVSPEGLIQVKIDGRGRRGWPDRLYMYRGYVVFIEYKVPGEKPTPIQYHVHNILKVSGFSVFVIDSIRGGVEVLLKWKHDVDQKLA